MRGPTRRRRIDGITRTASCKSDNARSNAADSRPAGGSSRTMWRITAVSLVPGSVGPLVLGSVAQDARAVLDLGTHGPADLRTCGPFPRTASALHRAAP